MRQSFNERNENLHAPIKKTSIEQKELAAKQQAQEDLEYASTFFNSVANKKYKIKNI